MKPANRKEDRIDRRFAENQSGKRKAVVVIRERDGRSIAQTFPSEAASTAFVKARVARGTQLMADEAGAWNTLHTAFPMKRIDHSKAYSDDGACTNGAEAFFSRLRRAEIGHHHHIAGAYLARYAREAAWRDDHRRLSTGAQFHSVVSLVAKNKPSVDFCGYWQRHKAA